MAFQLVSPRGLGIDPNGVDGQPHTVQSHRSASLWDWLWASTFPCQYPKLYGSLLELRNCTHRIQSLWKQEGIRYARIGPVYQPSEVAGHLLLNKRTQGRSLGIQKLLSDSPWLTSDDSCLFLAGWDAAEEWRERLDTQDSVACRES